MPQNHIYVKNLSTNQPVLTAVDVTDDALVNILEFMFACEERDIERIFQDLDFRRRTVHSGPSTHPFELFATRVEM